jgi:hypothetical protein
MTRDLAKKAAYDRRRYRENREDVIARTSAHIAEHGERYNAYNRTYRKRNREWLQEYLGSQSCVDCGLDDSDVLEFDHVRGEKRFTIGDRMTYSLDTLKDEIAKCDVRCCNCHRKRHRRETWATDDS